MDLSSAPSSPPEPLLPPEILAQRPPAPNAALQYHAGGAYRNPAGTTLNEATQSASRQDPPKQRKPRKPKDPSASASEATKPKVQRKPRAAPGTSAASKRKPKAENTENHAPIQNIPPTTDLQSSRLVEPYAFHTHLNSNLRPDEAAKSSQNGFLNHEQSRQPSNPPTPSYHSTHPPQPQPQPNSSRASGVYDPVRSITTPRPLDPPQTTLTPGSTSTPPRPTSRAGASPLANLIDGPMPSYSSASAPSPLRTFVTPADQQPQTIRPPEPSSTIVSSGPMDIDATCADENGRKSSTSKKPSSEGPTRATSPKPARAKEQPPPMPTGSGLLSASLFGGEIGVDAGKEATAKGPNIVIHIDLKDPKNKVINFARLAEEKYGFDALYPRQAAQRKRLNEIAARGAALERSASGSKFGGTSAGESGDDDISVDIDRDSDNDGDVPMGGVNGTDQVNSGTDGPEPKRRRRRKVEDYDQEDPFIDDSEQIWEQQAAASKDGFFVYCGPLVPEGEKPAVERYVLSYNDAVLLSNLFQGGWNCQARSWTGQRWRTWISRWSRCKSRRRRRCSRVRCT